MRSLRGVIRTSVFASQKHEADHRTYTNLRWSSDGRVWGASTYFYGLGIYHGKATFGRTRENLFAYGRGRCGHRRGMAVRERNEVDQVAVAP
jgi:hypothetical protein